MHIAELWRYPVASAGGERLTDARIEDWGVAGDRQFLLTCRANGEIACPESSIRWRPAPLIEARGSELNLTIRTPRSDWLPAFGRQAQAALDIHFGFPVALKATGLGHPERPMPSAPHSRYPRASVHLLTLRMLQRFEHLVPNAVADAKRFRANLVLDLDLDEIEEDETFRPGALLLLGGVEIEITGPATRCGFVALEQAGLARSPETLKAIKRHYGMDFGYYGRVLKRGRLRVKE